MLVDVTVYQMNCGMYEYDMFICHTPKDGVEEYWVDTLETRMNFALVWYEDCLANPICKLLPSHSIADRYSQIVERRGFEPIILAITEDES